MCENCSLPKSGKKAHKLGRLMYRKALKPAVLADVTTVIFSRNSRLHSELIKVRARPDSSAHLPA